MSASTQEPQSMLLRHHLKTLRLPTMLSEYAKLGREAAEKDESYESYLLKLSELEVNQRYPLGKPQEWRVLQGVLQSSLEEALG